MQMMLKVYKDIVDPTDEVSLQSVTNYISNWAEKLGLPLANMLPNNLINNNKKTVKFPSHSINSQVLSNVKEAKI